MGDGLGLESPFRNFTFEKLNVNDHARVMDVLRHSFITDEPVNKIFGYSEEKFAYLDLRVRIFLALNLSFAAVDKENKNIAALLLNIPHKKNHDLGIPPPKSLNNVRHFLSTIENQHNIYDKFNVSQYGEIFIAAVNRDYRGQGLATEMFRRSFDLFRQNGDTIIKCMVSSPFTRKITSNLGFIELGSWKFSEAKDEDGNALMPNLSDNQDGVAALTVFKL